MYVTPGIVCTCALVLALYTAPVELSEVYRCPNGLTGTMYTYGNQCYRYVHSSVTWDVANADCSSSNGGHLVVILDQATQNFISSLPFPSDAYHVWIGFSDKQQEQLWKWVTGEGWSFDAWADSNPQLCFGGNAACPEDCASLWTSDGYWREAHCNSAYVKYQYICQYNMAPTTTSTPSPTTRPTTTMSTTKMTTSKMTTTKMTTSPVTSKATTTSTTKATTLPVTTKVMTTTKTTSTYVTTVTSTTAVPLVGGTGQLIDDGGALSKGGLIGLVLALILVVTIIVFILLVIIRKRNRRKRYEGDDFQVRFQNHTYNTSQFHSSYQSGAGNDSKLYATSNIYETPGPKPCSGKSNWSGYEKPVNRSTLARREQENHYASMKECDMVDLPDTTSDKSYQQYEYLNNASSCLHNSTVSSETTDPSYVSPKPQKEVSDEVISNRSNEELLRCFEEYSKSPSSYDNNLYINDKNCNVNK